MTTLSVFLPGSSASTLDVVVVVMQGLGLEVEHQPGGGGQLLAERLRDADDRDVAG